MIKYSGDNMIDAYIKIALIEFLIILKSNKNFQDKLSEIGINYKMFEDIIFNFFLWDEEIKRIYREGLEKKYNWQYGDAEVAANNHIYNRGGCDENSVVYR